MSSIEDLFWKPKTKKEPSNLDDFFTTADAAAKEVEDKEEQERVKKWRRDRWLKIGKIPYRERINEETRFAYLDRDNLCRDCGIQIFCHFYRYCRLCSEARSNSRRSRKKVTGFEKYVNRNRAAIEEFQNNRFVNGFHWLES